MIQWPVVLDRAVRDRLVEKVAAAKWARVQLITGPSGIGKSTLTASISSQLKSIGFEVLPVVGMPELKEISLGAMAPLLASTDAPAFESTEDRLQRLFTLVARSSAQRVLIVDDGPMLDVVSASTVYQLVRIHGMRCVITARSGHPITGPLLRLRDEGFVEETELTGLRWPVAAGIVQRALGGTVEPDSLRALLALAAGNPLFLRGLVLAAGQADAVTAGRNGLVVDTSRLPRRLWDTIGLRFEGLSREDRTLADLIAIAEPWPEELLAAPDGSIERLEQAALVARTSDGEIYLAHPLFAESITSLLSEASRDGLRIEAARRLLGAERDDLRFKAMCILADSSEPPDPADLAWAAAAAHTVDDHALAIQLAARAIEREAEIEHSAPFQAHLVLASALSASGRLDEADPAFSTAAALASDDAQRATVATRHGFHLAVRRQRARDAVLLGEAALESMADAAARSYLAANVAKWRLITGELPPVLHTAPTTPDETADSATTLNELLYRLSVAVSAGDLTAMRTFIAAARPHTAAAHSVIRHGTEMVDFGEFLMMVLDGRVGAAVTFGEQKRGEIIEESAGMWDYGLALTALNRGLAPESLEYATSAVDLLSWRDFLGLLGTAAAMRATAAAQLGQSELAAEILDGIEPSARSYITTLLQAAEAEAWLAWNRGDESGAIHTITAAVEAGAAAHYFSFASLTAHVAVRMGHAVPVLKRLREFASEAPGELVAAILQHAEAAAAADASALLTAAERLEGAGLLAGAADAAHHAAVIAHAAGDNHGARRARERVAKLHVGRESALTQRELSDGFDTTSTLGLSQREWDIATAAAQRERNREIAKRLGLSPRTIENHLRNVFRKLGVSSRDELARVLTEPDAP